MVERSHHDPYSRDSLSRVQPGTLLWVGPTSHGEFCDAFRFCRDSVAQLAVRRGMQEALRRPAGFVTRVIFARPTRSTPPTALLKRFAVMYGEAAMLALCGQLCDGETRTGTAWPLGNSLRFSRWAERLPDWLATCGVNSMVVQPRVKATTVAPRGEAVKPAAILVIADRFEAAEPLLLLADSLSIPAAWHRRFIPALHQRFDAVLWDDSVAPAAPASIWRARVGHLEASKDLPPAAKSNPKSQSPRHVWLALQPSMDEIGQSLQGGIATVLTKPLHVDALVIEIAGRAFRGQADQRIRSA